MLKTKFLLYILFEVFVLWKGGGGNLLKNILNVLLWIVSSECISPRLFHFVAVVVFRPDLGKCTHLYDIKQGTVTHKRFQQKIIFIGCKKIDDNQKKKTDKELM